MPQDENTYGFNKSDAGELVQLIGNRDLTYTEGKVRGGGGNGSDGTHYLLTLTAAVSSGSGTATIRNMADDTEIATGVTVIDSLGNSDGYAIGKRGICVKQGGAYYILSMGRYVTDVRWDDPDLEQSRDGGASYSNIDTAVDCS